MKLPPYTWVQDVDLNPCSATSAWSSQALAARPFAAQAAWLLRQVLTPNGMTTWAQGERPALVPLLRAHLLARATDAPQGLQLTLAQIDAVLPLITGLFVEARDRHLLALRLQRRNHARLHQLLPMHLDGYIGRAQPCVEQRLAKAAMTSKKAVFNRQVAASTAVLSEAASAKLTGWRLLRHRLVMWGSVSGRPIE